MPSTLFLLTFGITMFIAGSLSAIFYLMCITTRGKRKKGKPVKRDVKQLPRVRYDKTV